MAFIEVDEPAMLDSTGQDIKDELTAIKSAVQGLGTALGSDRALIDGSNIANPSTFRSNIGAVGQSSFKKTTVYGTTNSYGAINLNIPFGANGYEVLSIRSNDNIYVIPFVYGTNWYAMFYAVGNHAPITNTSVNAVVCYADSSIFNIV